MPSKKIWALAFLIWLILPISMANPQTIPMVFEMPISNQFSGGFGEWQRKAHVAIVIDDFGQRNATGDNEILSLSIPITCAIMPNLENTQKHAVKAKEQGHQVIVHLPMEPINGKRSWLGPGAITMQLSEDEIKSVVSGDFKSVPYAVGFNNHMGSAVTSSAKIMRTVLQVAQERNFFVLDSRTTLKSKIPSLSKELGIAFVERDVFLDNVKNKDYVKKQLYKLSQEALKKGTAVGIGHVGLGGNITARALKEMIPQMKEMGIEFVYLSDIAYNKKSSEWKARDKVSSIDH